MARSEERHYDLEARRCLKGAGEFRRERLSAGTVLRRADVSAERLLEAVRLHTDRLLDPSRRGVLKADRRALVTRVEPPGDGAPPLCVKEFRRPRARQRLQDALRGSRARRAWLGAHACHVRGIAAPRALGILEGRGRCWFVSEYLTEAFTLQEWIADHRPARDASEVRAWRVLLLSAADFVARLHGHRLRHRDLAAKNILARERDGGFQLFLLDLSDVRLGRWPGRRFKIRNLGQLAQVPVPASRSDGLRFLRRYARSHPEVADRQGMRRIVAAARARQENWLAHGGREWLEDRRARRA